MTAKTRARVGVGVFLVACYGVGAGIGRLGDATGVPLWAQLVLVVGIIWVLLRGWGWYAMDRFYETL